MLPLLAYLLALSGVGALYFDCFMQTTTELCERSEYCVWHEDAQQCNLSAQSLYLLCLEDMRIPEEACLPTSSQYCNLTRNPDFCNLQTPCSWKEENGNTTTVELAGNATAELAGNATAELTGNATAELTGNATAELTGNATAGCQERVYEPWTEVPTASPTQSPKNLRKYTRSERVKCCAHTWRVCFPTPALQDASASVKALQVAKAKHNCKLPDSATMNDLCIQARTNLKCPSTRTVQ
ncbi:hypothetical protein BASA81_000973 [Batrachochytrium salamandrivorans]|nr:hypothetical protein BASA81_000973 [Batrachochytrium salamandrivorans]